MKLLHEGEGNTPAPAVAQPAPAADPIDRETYDALVGYYQSTRGIMEPLLQDETARKTVERYTQDADYRKLVDDTDGFYEEYKRRSSPESQMPAWAKAMQEENKKFRDELTTKIIKPREEAQERETRAYQQQQAASAKDLMEKKGIDLPTLRAIAAYGDQLGIKDINDAYKHFTTAMNKQEKPAASLRSDAAAPGVPGESTNDTKPPKNREELAARMARNLRSVS